jgi:hypothetical protein
MSEQEPQPTMRGAIAGTLILAAIVGCGLLGLGIGALLGAAAPLAIVGVCAGLPVGFVLVRARFRDL